MKHEIAEALGAEFPDNGKDVKAVLGDVEYESAARAGARHRAPRRRPQAERSAADHDRHGVLPRAHGSALFTRGQTQALVAATLGTANDVQRLDSIDEAKRDHQVVHAALQLPAVLHG